MKYFFEKNRFIFIVGGVLLVLVAIYFKTNQMEAKSDQIVLANEQLQGQEQVVEVEKEKLFVDVKGAVKTPGLYEFADGDRVFDVLLLAGGILEYADEKQINYAERLEDEMIIYIPKIGEVPEEDSLHMQSSSGENANGKININKANEAELTTLSGIGPAKAQAIIQYREENGPFKAIEDLLNISGIGEKTLEKFKASITVK